MFANALDDHIQTDFPRFYESDHDSRRWRSARRSLPSGFAHSLLLKVAIECFFVDLPIVIFYSYVNVYRRLFLFRVTCKTPCKTPCETPVSPTEKAL